MSEGISVWIGRNIRVFEEIYAWLKLEGARIFADGAVKASDKVEPPAP